MLRKGRQLWHETILLQTILFRSRCSPSSARQIQSRRHPSRRIVPIEDIPDSSASKLPIPPRTSFKGAKGPLLQSAATPIKSCDLFLEYENLHRRLVALSGTLAEVSTRPQVFLSQLRLSPDDPGHGQPDLSIAWTIARRCFGLSSSLTVCRVRLNHSLNLFLPNHKGVFATHYRFLREPSRGLTLTRSVSVHFGVTGRSDLLVLELTAPPQNYTKASDVIPPRLGQLPLGQSDTNGPFAREVAVAKELSHHIPLYVGHPALQVQQNLKRVASTTASRVAPKDYWQWVDVRLSHIDPLQGSTFGTDQEMETLQPSRQIAQMQGTATVHRAYIALGSNIGDRVKHIEDALREMENHGLAVQRASPLYETKAMYVVDQDPFMNGVCEIQTVLEPIQLLDTLQKIENRLGRVKVIDKGPRNIDLDVILYDDQRINTERLIVPHRLMLEREFVLQPLSTLIPDNSLPPPGDSSSFRTHLLRVIGETPDYPRAVPVVSVNNNFPLLRPYQEDKETHIMAILNITPDSFSDGGMHTNGDPEKLMQTVRGFIKSGATILDIGGQSTRPNAKLIAAKEEITRIVPVIQLIRSMPEAQSIAISIDTFYARVAKAAVDAGADIVNDISGGRIDPEMFPTVAAIEKTIVITHSRGHPATMNKLTNYENGVLQGVAEELVTRVQEALEAGVRPWRIILDPGIGFAKTIDQNLELLRHFSFLRDFDGLQHYPWLLGTSRKKFVGTVTGVAEARDRVYGTAATVTAGIREGVDIIRVHDVDQMVQVATMSDAIYRPKSKSHQSNSKPESASWSATEADPNSGLNIAGSNDPHHPLTSSEREVERVKNGKFSNIEEHPFYGTLLGNDAIATDGLNTAHDAHGQRQPKDRKVWFP